MSQVLTDNPPEILSGRSRRAEGVTSRVRRDGKFFRLGREKFFVKGVTYGPFAPNSAGEYLPSPEQTRRDFEQILGLGCNCIRVYHVPPLWLLDLAMEVGLKVFVDVPWPKHLTFVGDPEVEAAARQAVREAARSAGNHEATFAISVVNEMPSEVVRFIGHKRVEAFVDELIEIAKSEAPDCLVTFANYPPTEFIQPAGTDFVCFNVYLHDEKVLRNYLARLQSIAGEKPLMLGEYGIDTMHEYDEQRQAEILEQHVRAAFDEGLVGTFIFAYTDDWFTGGYQIDNWAFGITRRDRSPKPACERLKGIFARVPQTADLAEWPMMSVIICSYNGAGTVESCLRSMQRIRYPNFEVVFVDDGSRDHTQAILKQFEGWPHLRIITQKNMGLSFARNVGMNAAKGEIIVYTDSDCEADEEWLYYLALAMKRSKHVGMGGPNLIPDEGSWVADCVGLSPGGPTHVMIDDREAEHVPGCNMAFYTWAAKEIGGFDSQFRKAGDDVDFIWRLQNRGYSIGFAPAAQVWHYRRNTIDAYLRQQRGYGEAEALLKYKHPGKFNALGASHWKGKIYGSDIGVHVGRDVIYHGVFGTGLFQTIYRQPASLVAAMLSSIEWHWLTAFVAILGLAFIPSEAFQAGRSIPEIVFFALTKDSLLFAALIMFAIPVALSAVAAIQSPMPRHKHPLSRLLIAWLHFRQPIARGWARHSVMLKARVLGSRSVGLVAPHDLPLDPNDRHVLRYWSDYEKYIDRIRVLERIGENVQKVGWRMRMDSGWSPFDMELYLSRYVRVRLLTATEHHAKGMLTRIRVQVMISTFTRLLLLGSSLLTILLIAYLWPSSRPAILLPLVWWSMYLISKQAILSPVVALVHQSAMDVGLVGVSQGEAPAEKS
jgi:GT2 family glycosyltransferase